jgi:hypothetical protein
VADGNLVLLLVDAVWLTLLGFGAVVIHREIGIISARLAAAGTIVPDGLELGVAVPRGAGVGRDQVLLFLFGDCAPCHQIARQLASVSRPDRICAVVKASPQGPETADDLIGALPAPVARLDAGTAERCTALFQVRSAPLGIAVRDGIVVAKSYLRSVGQVEFLVDQLAIEGAPQ